MKNSIVKKILTTIAVSSAVAALSVTMASATGSGYMDSRTVQPGTWISSSSNYACYSAAATAKGSSTYTYFRYFGSISTVFASNSNRTLSFYLMEKDFLGGDDQVKTYSGKFSGRTLTEINLTTTNITGDIESTNDNCAELYGKFMVARMTGDSPTDTITSGLFEYNVGIN